MSSTVAFSSAEAFDLFDEHQPIVSWADYMDEIEAEASNNPLDPDTPCAQREELGEKASRPADVSSPSSGASGDKKRRKKKCVAQRKSEADFNVEALCGLRDGVNLSTKPPIESPPAPVQSPPASENIKKQDRPATPPQCRPPVSRWQEPPVSRRQEPPVSRRQEPPVSRRQEPPVSRRQEPPPQRRSPASGSFRRRPPASRYFRRRDRSDSPPQRRRPASGHFRKQDPPASPPQPPVSKPTPDVSTFVFKLPETFGFPQNKPWGGQVFPTNPPATPTAAQLNPVSKPPSPDASKPSLTFSFAQNKTWGVQEIPTNPPTKPTPAALPQRPASKPLLRAAVFVFNMPGSQSKEDTSMEELCRKLEALHLSEPTPAPAPQHHPPAPQPPPDVLTFEFKLPSTFGFAQKTTWGSHPPSSGFFKRQESPVSPPQPPASKPDVSTFVFKLPEEFDFARRKTWGGPVFPTNPSALNGPRGLPIPERLMTAVFGSNSSQTAGQ